MQRREIRIWWTCIGAVLLAIGMGSSAFLIWGSPDVLGLRAASRLQQQFLDTIAAGAELNGGITIVRSIPGGPWSSPNDIAFIVLNHTSEAIVFPNQGFGFQLYWPDTTSQVWHTIALQTYPTPTPTVLPPRLETIDFDVANVWSIDADDWPSADYRLVRLYISGTGSVTKKQYGAYLDVRLKP